MAGKLYGLWEWYKVGATYKDAAKAISECPYYEQIQNRIVADNSMWALNQSTDAGVKSVAQLLGEEGIRLIRGKRGTPSADVRVAEMFRAHYWADFDNPLALITIDCPK